MQKLLASIALLSPFSASAGGEGDNSVVRQMQYSDFNYVHNLEYGSLNPVSASGIPINELAVISAGYNWRQGDYHRIDDSGHSNGLSVDAYGIKRLDRVVFEGGLAYFNQNDRSRCWNSSLFQNKLNPFILADSEPSDYNTERFRVNGRMSYNVSNVFRFGINADYNVGVMSDESDPRLETKGMRFIINPGVQWDVTTAFSVGATGGVNLFNESAHYTCVQTALNFQFYIMSGLGTFYPQSGASYTRDAKGTSWFASVDFRYKFSNNVSDYLSVTYSRENENATDGGSTYQFKAGEYLNDKVHFYNRLSFVSPRAAHNVEIWAESNTVKGRWFDQKSVTENGTTHYEVMGSSIKHKESRVQATMSYRFDRLDRQGVSSFTAGGSATFLMSDTKNYPELYFQKYSRIYVSANVMKHFMVKRVRFGVGLDGAYATSLSASSDFNGLELEHKYSLPLYAYLTSSSVAVNGCIEAKLPVKDFIIGVYIAGGTEMCIGGKLDNYKNDGLNSLNCGLSLAF